MTKNLHGPKTSFESETFFLNIDTQFTLHSVEMKRAVTLSTCTLINNLSMYNHLVQKKK